MRIIQNCWDQIDTYNCQYGAHIFDGSTAKIYVNQWLAPSKELFDFFTGICFDDLDRAFESGDLQRLASSIATGTYQPGVSPISSGRIQT